MTEGTLAASSAASDACRYVDPGTTQVLQLDGVGKMYRRGDEQVHVLVDFDFILDTGEFVVVTGPSGPANRPSCILPEGLTLRTAAPWR